MGLGVLPVVVWVEFHQGLRKTKCDISGILVLIPIVEFLQIPWTRSELPVVNDSSGRRCLADMFEKFYATSIARNHFLYLITYLIAS